MPIYLSVRRSSCPRRLCCTTCAPPPFCVQQLSLLFLPIRNSKASSRSIINRKPRLDVVVRDSKSDRLHGRAKQTLFATHRYHSIWACTGCCRLVSPLVSQQFREIASDNGPFAAILSWPPSASVWAQSTPGTMRLRIVQSSCSSWDTNFPLETDLPFPCHAVLPTFPGADSRPLSIVQPIRCSPHAILSRVLPTF